MCRFLVVIIPAILVTFINVGTEGICILLKELTAIRVELNRNCIAKYIAVFIDGTKFSNVRPFATNDFEGANLVGKESGNILVLVSDKKLICVGVMWD